MYDRFKIKVFLIASLYRALHNTNNSDPKFNSLKSSLKPIETEINLYDTIDRNSPFKDKKSTEYKEYMLAECLNKGVWDKAADFLRDSNNMILVNYFIEHADESIWSDWKIPRGNMSRFLIMQDYYKKLFS